MIPKDTLLFESTPPASPVKSASSPLFIFVLPQLPYLQSLPHSLKNNGGATPSTIPSTILDLPMRPRYCANETPVASLPHPAATADRAPVCSFPFRESNEELSTRNSRQARKGTAPPCPSSSSNTPTTRSQSSANVPSASVSSTSSLSTLVPA